MKQILYKKSFNLFLKRTDEKKVIYNFINTNIHLHGKIRFLDIGGGDGTLSRMISDKVDSVVIIEPNKFIFRNSKRGNKLKIINSKWEELYLNDTYDFILAAYVVTYFPEKSRKQLIEKMYNNLAPGGTILILSVDARRGSWRKIHSFFYRLIGHKHYSSDDEIRKIIKKYNVVNKMFKTRVVAKDSKEMLKILNFDFGRYPEEYKKFSEELQEFMCRYTDESGRVILEVFHNAYFISKSLN